MTFLLDDLPGEPTRRLIAPALRLYESAAFVRCGPFDDYTDDPFSVFMMRSIG